jgi:hypothetical protein
MARRGTLSLRAHRELERGDDLDPDSARRRKASRARQRGGRERAARHRARLRTFPRFLLVLVNTGWREPAVSERSPEATVRTLGRRYGRTVADAARRFDFPHTRSRTKLTLIPFVLAGWGVAQILVRIAATRSREAEKRDRLLEDVVELSERNQAILRDRWGTWAFAARLFRRPSERDAWVENCREAGRWVELLRHRDVQARLHVSVHREHADRSIVNAKIGAS